MIITLVLLAILSCMPAFSATYYDNGSQRFTITAGVNFPISTTLFEDERTLVGHGFDFDKTKFTLLGGYGSLTYQMFVNPYFALGGEIGYGFNYYIDDALLTNVPMQFKVSFIPLQGTIEIPLSLGAGFSYMSVSDGGAYMPFFLSFETGLDWYITDNWGIGIKSGLWVIPELYFDSSKSYQNALQTFIPLTLSVTYRQYMGGGNRK